MISMFTRSKTKNWCPNHLDECCCAGAFQLSQTSFALNSLEWTKDKHPTWFSNYFGKERSRTLFTVGAGNFSQVPMKFSGGV